jgi:transposase
VESIDAAGCVASGVELSAAEAQIVKRVRRAKLFVMLWLRRHELFDEGFQAELAELYGDGPKGQLPVPPAQLTLATILQAYTGASDDEVIEATVMDRRWQLVLDCLDVEQPPFAKGTLQNFRGRLIAANLDRRLVEHTVELAATPAAGRQLRAALDSSPLWGAGRVEDTLNLMGHALRKALGVIAVQQGWGWPREPACWPGRPAFHMEEITGEHRGSLCAHETPPRSGGGQAV